MTPEVAVAGVAVMSRPGGSVWLCTMSARGACAGAATGTTAIASSAARTTTSAAVRRMRTPLWLFEELDGPAQPLVEIDERRVAHQPLGLADVGEGVRHVARTARGVTALHCATEEL